MDRESTLKEILLIKNNNILFELPTGYGKSKIAIEILKKRKVNKVLVIVPKLVLIDNWKDEINKWYPDSKVDFSFSTYVSLPKHIDNWDMVIFDEAHRLSERCREALKYYKIKYSILLSATVKKQMKDALRKTFSNLYSYKISVKTAVENDILPDPKVILLPLTLNSTKEDCKIIINSKAKGTPIETSYINIWRAKKDKTHKYIIRCTQKQRYNEWCSTIDWYKNKRHIAYMKNIWLHQCGERLRWLSIQKNALIPKILEYLKEERVLTFCSSIEQTELFGKYCINSKNKDSEKYLRMFNKGKIKHITAANMLNEGVNLVNCRIGLYANLNSSEIIIKQRLGRILRHKHPIIIIPYFKHTREEEIVKVMLEDYNPDLVKTINFIEEIDL